MPFDRLQQQARAAAPAGADWWSVRGVDETAERLLVRQGIAQAPQRTRDAGAMVCVRDGAGMGYAATPDVSEAGLRAAFAQAQASARASAGRSVFDASQIALPVPKGHYASPNARPMAGVGLKERYELLNAASASAKSDDAIVDWSASLWTTHTDQLLVTSDGGLSEQISDFVVPNITATAARGGETQTRSAYGQYNGYCQQGGLEVLERAGFQHDGARVADEALQLLAAADCPTGTMPVLLMPDQMMLQIHESIGHPLELDRILGDERNFAGTSFVTLDMFGNYQWGSDLLDVTFDPTVQAQFASFSHDDDGTPAERQYLIRGGQLLRPLGGSLSQARARALGAAHIDGVATSRAVAWNRAPIDRMSNLNIEAGASTLDELIGRVEYGVLMKTNQSWSIDDSRNKFQFGCEWGQVIRNGRLAEVVKNPNYRGVSATFWRNLTGVGDDSTREVMGTPYCGKGEPSQVIRVGHASPACLFADVAVFGGGQ